MTTGTVKCHFCKKDDSEDKGQPIWVGCEFCDSWCHLTCVPIQFVVPKLENPSQLLALKEKHVESFKCTLHDESKCALLKLKGVSVGTEDIAFTNRNRLRNKRPIDYIALNEGNDKRLKHEHPHTQAFLACFERWKDPKTISSSELESDFQNIKVPLRVSDPADSGMYVISANELGLVDSKDHVKLNVEYLTKIMGDDYPLDVMDVQTQMNEKWTLSQWNEYYSHTSPSDRDRIRNVISLEVSHVESFKDGIRRPNAVNNNDLVDIVWNFEHTETDIERPKVTKYILMSVGNAYTDFHLDFAGTSVYYNVISGSKKFILFPPTEYNLKKYREWCDNDNQNVIFLGDQLEEGIAMELTEGNLFMIPCGYIHAVYTPEDSFIVGGNFLTLRDITTQLTVVEIEHQTKVPKRFTFPQFESVMGKTCEWILNSDHIQSISSKDIENLVKYLSSSNIKYKPINYKSKKELITDLKNKIIKL
ncbi:Jhd1 [Kluyveromyces lactis]|nr:Jhd1 [Kluyveromyces lactis]